MSSSMVLKVYKKENANSDDQNILRVQNLFNETEFVQENQNILKPKFDETWCRRRITRYGCQVSNWIGDFGDNLLSAWLIWSKSRRPTIVVLNICTTP